MSKSLKKEITKYLHQNPEILIAQKEAEIEGFLHKILQKNQLKGIKEIAVKKNTLIIKTQSPSWRQELLFFKKEIIKKINKKARNYTIEKIIIL